MLCGMHEGGWQQQKEEQQQMFTVPSSQGILMLLTSEITQMATTYMPLMEAILMGGLLTLTMACDARAGVSNNSGESDNGSSQCHPPVVR
jgi:hypothetical protein